MTPYNVNGSKCAADVGTNVHVLIFGIDDENSFDINPDPVFSGEYWQTTGYSVRCVRDASK